LHISILLVESDSKQHWKLAKQFEERKNEKEKEFASLVRGNLFSQL